MFITLLQLWGESVRRKQRSGQGMLRQRDDLTRAYTARSWLRRMHAFFLPDNVEVA